MAAKKSAEGLDETAARDLGELVLGAFGKGSAAKKNKAAIDEVFELARQQVGGKRALLITGISVGPILEVSSGEGSVAVVANQSGPPVDAKKPRKVIAYGDSHKTCRLVTLPWGESWYCVYF